MKVPKIFKPKGKDDLSNQGKIIKSIIELVQEKKDLEDKLEDLRDNTLSNLNSEVNDIIHEIEILKKAIEVNDRKLSNAAFQLEEESNIYHSGMYA